MQPSRPVETDIVLLGAGHAHVEVLRRFAMRPEPGVRLTLIGREPETPYSGMLPGLIRGDYTFEQAHILRDALNATSDPLDRARLYGRDIEKTIRPYFDSMVTLDLQAIRRAAHERNPDYKPGLRARIARSFAEDGLIPAQRGDAEVGRALSRIFHMLDEPATLFKRPAIVARILRVWAMPKARKRALDYYIPPLGPERGEMLSRLGIAA